MNCVHVCGSLEKVLRLWSVSGSLLWYMGLLMVSGGILCLLYKSDSDLENCDVRRLRCLWGICCFFTGAILYWQAVERAGVEIVCYWLLAVYFVLCCVMDCLLKMVCDFFHYIGLIGGCVLLVQMQPPPAILFSLLLFVILQWRVFLKMYGPADVLAFVICAIYLAAEGRDIESYLIHMAVTFLVLGVVQGLRKNISSKGNLKHPVALLPYIIIGFFVII